MPTPKPSGGRRRAVRRENTSHGLAPVSSFSCRVTYSATSPASSRYLTFCPQSTARSGRRNCFLRWNSFFWTSPDSAQTASPKLPKAQTYPQKNRSNSKVKPHSPSRESVKLSAVSTSPAPMCRKICFTPEKPATNAPGMDTKKNSCTPVRSHVRRFWSR